MNSAADFAEDILAHIRDQADALAEDAKAHVQAAATQMRAALYELRNGDISAGEFAVIAEDIADGQKMALINEAWGQRKAAIDLAWKLVGDAAKFAAVAI